MWSYRLRMGLERLSARLLADGVPPSLLIDLFDTDGMEHALAAELAEVEAARTLQETNVAEPVVESDQRTA